MKLATIKIDQISAGDNIRKDITKESLGSLIISIKESGILQPLLVRENGDKFELVAGFRRYNAAKYADLKEVPALIADIKKDDRVEYQLIENLQRKDLNPLDEALAYQALGEDYPVKDIVVITGKPEYRIRRVLTLLNLCPEVKEMVKKGELSEEHAFVITYLPLAKSQKDLANETKRYKYSPARIEQELKRFSQRLESALFDKTQCKKCAFNVSLIEDLFDKKENELYGQCLNVDCFFKKITEIQKTKEAELKKSGKKVIVIKDEPQYGSKEYEALKEVVDFSGYEAQSFPKEQFETECSVTCPTFAFIIGPTGQDKTVCLNQDCFKRSLRKAKAIERKATAIPKTGDPEKDASISYEARQKENRVDFFKRDFFIKGLKEKVSDKQLNRILLHQLFALENSNGESISELLKLEKKQPNYMVREIARLETLSNERLLNLIKELILNHLNDYDTTTLEILGNEANLNIGKQFVITKEYLEKYSKAGLMKFSKEIKLKVGSLVWKEKKDEIVKILLGSGCKGKVPKEMIK